MSFLVSHNGILTYPRLSDPDYGVSNYNISQSVTYEVVLNFTLTHKSGFDRYYFKFARLDNRVPNSSLTPYCPPYQESELLYSDITGNIPAQTIEGHYDRFNNTYDSFNATLPIDGNVTFDQKYTVKLNEIYFNGIEDTDIGLYNTSDEIFDLYCNHTEPYYERHDPSLISLSNSIVSPSDNPVEKAEKICNWVSHNIVYNGLLPKQEMGALWAYNNLQGDCSEYSSLMITLLRIQGIPARKISGFVISNYPLTRPAVGNTWNFHTDHINSTMMGHAWIEYFVPSIGWIACDPTWHSAYNYFNRIDFLRFNINAGANFFFPDNYTVSEFLNPIIRIGDYEFSYDVKITVLEANLSPLPEFPIFVVVFIIIGFV